MNESIACLTNLIKPPAEPILNFKSITWDEIETVLGHTLPDDYKSIIETYGEGVFNKYFGFYNPFKSENLNLFKIQITMLADLIQERHIRAIDYVIPFDLYPYSDIIPLGSNDDSALFCWWSDGTTQKIYTFDADFSPQYGEYEMTVSTFLCQWLSKTLTPYSFRKAKGSPSFLSVRSHT